MSRFNNESRPEIIMHLLELQGPICAGEGCTHVFNSMDEIRVDHGDNCPNHNCSLNFKRLLCDRCNIKKGKQYHELIGTHPEFDTSWLKSDYSKFGFQARRRGVCVPPSAPVEEWETVRIVRPFSESWSVQKKEVKQEYNPVHAIIPRERAERDDHEDTDTSSQSINKDNQPKYFLYFMLQAKLGYAFRATEAKKKFALSLNIPHGTIKNHYYPTMSEYFERDTRGYFLPLRKQDAKPFLEENEIDWMIAAHRQNKLHDCDAILSLYAGVLDMQKADLMQMFYDAPVFKA